jgi:hypothetical protein
MGIPSATEYKLWGDTPTDIYAQICLQYTYSCICESLIIGKFFESIVVLKYRLIYEVRCSSKKNILGVCILLRRRIKKTPSPEQRLCFTAQFTWSAFHHIFKTTLYTALKRYIYCSQKHNIHHNQTYLSSKLHNIYYNYLLITSCFHHYLCTSQYILTNL